MCISPDVLNESIHQRIYSAVRAAQEGDNCLLLFLFTLEKSHREGQTVKGRTSPSSSLDVTTRQRHEARGRRSGPRLTVFTAARSHK